MLDRSQKIVGVVGGILSISSLTIGVWIGNHDKASASELEAVVVKQASQGSTLEIMAKQVDWLTKVVWQGRPTEPPPTQELMTPARNQ